MLLVSAVVMMAKLVHENMQKHEGPSLSLGEATCRAILVSVIGNAQLLKDILMGIEIWRGNFFPKILAPSMKINRSSFLPVVKGILPVRTVAGTRQDYALEPFREAFPVRHDVNECLHVSLANRMAESSSR